MLAVDNYWTDPANFWGPEKDHAIMVLVVFFLTLVTAMELTDIHNQSR